MVLKRWKLHRKFKKEAKRIKKKKIIICSTRKLPSELEERWKRIESEIRNPFIDHSLNQCEQDFYDTIRHSIASLEEQGFEPINRVNIESEFNRVPVDFSQAFPKKHPMDRKYPHKCHNCKRPLRWHDLIGTNCITGLAFAIQSARAFERGFKDKAYQTYKHLKKLWRSPHVQFYCCMCIPPIFEEEFSGV